MNLFKSFAVRFQRQEDFDVMAQIKNSFNFIDISWSEKIFNFDNEEERQKFVEVATSKTYSINQKDLDLFDD